MRKYTLFLHEIRPNLFDFPSPFPDEYRPVFEALFYERYANYQIGAETERQFRQWVRNKFLSKLPRYLRLYASVDLFNNPFVNVVARTEQAENEGIRTKNYGTYNSEGLLRNDGIDSSFGDNVVANSEQQFGGEFASNRYIDKERELRTAHDYVKDNVKNTELFSDTPQNGEAIGHIEQDGWKLDGTGNRTAPWNQGYLTTGRSNVTDQWRENANAGGVAGSRYGGQKNSRETTNEVVAGTKGVNRNVANSQQKQNTETLSNTYEVSGRARQNTVDRVRYGLEGITLSSALMEWRKTFINIDDLFLDEFADCFLSIY